MSVIAPFSPSSLAAMLTVAHHSYSHVDFKNPDDPHDKSFDAHPTNYPVGELEFPNSGASERCVSHFFFFFASRASLASGKSFNPSIACSVEVLYTPLCNACVVPSPETSDLDPQRAFNLSCSPVSTSFLPWFHCEALSHITNPMLHIDTARLSFSLPRLPPLFLVASARSVATPLTSLRPVLPTTVYAPPRLHLIPQFPRVRGGLQLVFFSTNSAPLPYFSASLLCL